MSVTREATAPITTLGKVLNFFVKHPYARTIMFTGIKYGAKQLFSSSTGKVPSPNTSGLKDHTAGGNNQSSMKNISKVMELTTEKMTERSSPTEHMVHGHRQLYHTENGPKLIEKPPYSHGVKKK